MFIIPFENIICTSFLQHLYKYFMLCGLNRHFLSDNDREWKCINKVLGRKTSCEVHPLLPEANLLLPLHKALLCACEFLLFPCLNSLFQEQQS